MTIQQQIDDIIADAKNKLAVVMFDAPARLGEDAVARSAHGRAMALAQTKLDEARLWAQEAAK